MDFRYIIPIGPMLVALALIGTGISSSQPSKSRLDPEAVETIARSDYLWKAEIYTAQGEKEKALATCLAMVAAISASDSKLCLLDVYGEFNDFDDKIQIYEKQYQEEISDGDSGALTKLVIEGLKEERDKKK